MKRLLFILAAFICFVQLNAQNNNRTIKIGVIANAAPYSYVNKKGQVEGFSIDLIKSIMTGLGYSYEFVIYDQNIFYDKNNTDFYDKALSECDILAVGIPSIDDKQRHYFSIPYSQIDFYIISREDNYFNGLKDLYGQDVIVEENSRAERRLEVLEEDFLNNLIKVPTAIGIKMLSEKSADYMVINDLRLRGFRRFITNNDLQIFPSNFEALRISIASNDGEFIREINQTIQLFTQSGSLDKMYNKWLKIDEDTDNSVYFFFALIVLSLITAILLLLSITHKRAIKIARKDLAIELESKEKRINSINMAMRSTGLIRWEYNIKDAIIKFSFNETHEVKMTMRRLLRQIADADRGKVITYLQKGIAGNSMEDILIKAILGTDKEYKICNISSTIQRDKNGNPQAIYGIINDITELTRHNQKIEELQRNMQMALDSGQMSAWTYDKQKDIFTILYGAELTGDSLTMEEYMSHVHPDDKDIFPSALKDALDGRVDKTIIRLRLATAEKGYRWYSYTLMPIYKDKDIRYVTGIQRDFTEEMNSKIELEKSQNRLQSIIDRLPIPIYIKNPQTGILVYTNDEAKRFLFEVKDIVSIEDVVTENCAKKCQEVDAWMRQTNEDYIANEVIEMRDGEIKNTFVKKILIEFNNEEHILGVRLDLSEQEKLARAQKLISASFPSLNAFTWNLDSRNNHLSYGSTIELGNVRTEDVDTVEKFAKFVHEEDRENFIKTFFEQIAKNKNGNFSISYRANFTPTAPYEWWEVRGVSEVIHGGELEYVLLYGVTINVNSQKQTELSLRESQAKLLSVNKQNELILNNTSSGIVFIDSNYVVQWSNLHSLKSFKLSSSFFEIGSKCHFTFGYHDTCPKCPISNCYTAPQNWSQELDLGDEGVYHILTTPIIKDNRLEGAVLRIDNITERKALIKDLEIAKDKAEESERLKMAFLANMSHEIRTPLNAIIGFSELLQDTVDEDEKKEYINIITKNNELLLRLIGDILDLSKIESGTVDLKPEEFDLVESCLEAHALWQQQNGNPNIEFTIETPYHSCIVTLDKSRIIQVGTNFLTNAFKYTPSGKVTMGYIYENGGIKIYVKDTGIGIAEDKQEMVFERFAKLNDFAQGTGLGLPISKAIAEACGGKIGFTSKEGEGSFFWAWFPCEAKITYIANESPNENPANESKTTELKKRRSKKINILIAEDNDSNYMLIQAILKNYNLTRASNGAEAIELARKNSYNLILMDVRMPVMDGLKATRQIREFDPFTYIIALTANAFDADRLAAKEAGCNAFLTKPLKKRELEEILNNLQAKSYT